MTVALEDVRTIHELSDVSQLVTKSVTIVYASPDDLLSTEPSTFKTEDIVSTVSYSAIFCSSHFSALPISNDECIENQDVYDTVAFMGSDFSADAPNAQRMVGLSPYCSLLALGLYMIY